MINVREFVTHPLTWISSFLSIGTAYLGWLDPLIAFLSANADLLFGATVLFQQVGSNVGIPTGLTTKLVVVFGVLALLVRLDRIVERLQDRLK